MLQDTVSAIVEQIEGLGFRVRMQNGSLTLRVIAVNPLTGEVFSVRSTAHDKLRSVCALAELVGA